jgi:hypothetical protein
MSEVDRLSNSGLYPALPIADQRSRKDGSSGGQPNQDKKTGESASKAAKTPDSNPPRPPKSLIDDYA